jgi:hypothetical protein
MNLNSKRCIIKAIKMLEAGDAVEAVSALELAELQPMDWETKRTIRNAKEEADIGSPEKAEILLGLIDLKVGEVVISRDGINKGKTTGGERHCSMEGCRGTRLGVRWHDGKLTWPCTHGMTFDTREQVWKIK